MELGLLCYPMGGTVDGARGDHVLLAPPFIIGDDELDFLIERLVEAVDTAIAAVAPDFVETLRLAPPAGGR